MAELEGRQAALQEEARAVLAELDLSALGFGPVLRIKDAWHRRPEYPDEVGGADIYSAVLDDGVGDPEGFATWLTRRASSVSGA